MNRCLILIYLTLLIGCAHLPTTTERGKCQLIREQVKQLKKDRLMHMQQVAIWKWCNKKPIEDLPREQQILDRVNKEGEEIGLDSTKVRSFFQELMDEAKEKQRSYFDQFKAIPPICAKEDPEALLQARTKLDVMRTNFLRLLKDAQISQCEIK